MHSRTISPSEHPHFRAAFLYEDIDNVNREPREIWSQINNTSDEKSILYMPELGLPPSMSDPHWSMSKSWSPSRQRSKLFLELNSTDVRGHLSAEIARSNILETTSESERETDVKKARAPFALADRKSTDNRFLNVLRDPEQPTSSSDRFGINRINYGLKNHSSIKFAQMSQEEQEDSEDSMANIDPLKPRIHFVDKYGPEPIWMKNPDEEYLKELRGISKFDPEKLREKSNLSSSRRSSSKAQSSKTKKHFTSSMQPENDSESERRHQIVKSRVSRQAQEDKMSGHRFEAVFINNSATGLPLKAANLTEGMDTLNMIGDVEPRVPMISSPSSEISVGSKNDVADNQPNTTSPRSKFFKAFKRSSKGRQDEVRNIQNMSNLSDVYHAHGERSFVLKPKSIMMKRALDISSSENPFEEVITRQKGGEEGGREEEEEYNTETDSSTPIKNRATPELSVTKETIKSTELSHSLRTTPTKLKKWLNKKDIPRRHSPSIDSDEDGSIYNELQENSEKQHTEVQSIAGLLSAALCEREIASSEKSYSLKSVLTDKVSEISKNSISVSKTPVEMNTNKSELFKAATEDLRRTATRSQLDHSESPKHTAHHPLETDAFKKVRLTRSNSKGKFATPKIANDVPAELPRRSMRLNNSAEHSNNLILGSEVKTHNVSQTRSPRKSKNASVDKRASTIISNKSTGLEEAVNEMKDATPLSQTSLENTFSSEDQTDDKMKTRRTSARLSPKDPDESNVKKNKITSLRQSSSTRSRSQLGSSVKASSKDIPKNDASASKTPVVEMDTNELKVLEIMNDNLLDETAKKLGRPSMKRAAEQDVHLKTRLIRNKSPDPKFVSDVPAKMSRRSMRLNNSVEHSNSLISESKVETRNTSRERSNISKTNAPNKTIEDFFNVKSGSSSGNKQAKSLKIFQDAKKMQQIKEQMEIMKNRELVAMKVQANKTGKKQLVSNAKTSNFTSMKAVKKKLPVTSVKKMDPAYLVNGKVYKVPKLVRPKQWATNRLYNFLWKRMEPKYKLSMRVRSEKFVEELNKIVTLIMRRKKYDNYKVELEALMKEMARLEIINTRSDFYNFCREFMPYEFRVKVIPILLPGNQKTIPYDPEMLYTPLLNE